MADDEVDTEDIFVKVHPSCRKPITCPLPMGGKLCSECWFRSDEDYYDQE